MLDASQCSSHNLPPLFTPARWPAAARMPCATHAPQPLSVQRAQRHALGAQPLHMTAVAPRLENWPPRSHKPPSPVLPNRCCRASVTALLLAATNTHVCASTLTTPPLFTPTRPPLAAPCAGQQRHPATSAQPRNPPAHARARVRVPPPPWPGPSAARCLRCAQSLLHADDSSCSTSVVVTTPAGRWSGSTTYTRWMPALCVCVCVGGGGGGGWRQAGRVQQQTEKGGAAPGDGPSARAAADGAFDVCSPHAHHQHTSAATCTWLPTDNSRSHTHTHTHTRMQRTSARPAAE
jgi:hypothetical protein